MNGDELSESILEGFELRPDETAVLDSACRLADEIETMEAELDKSGPVVQGSRNQTRPHPLIAEVRSHRLALARLLKQLGLGDVDNPLTDLNRHALIAARARWQGRVG